MFPRYFTIKTGIFEKENVSKEIPDSEEKCSSSEPDDLEDIYKESPNFENYDYPNDYWKFQKCIKYLSYGKPLITSLVFITSIDCDFQDPIMLKSLHQHRVLEILINILLSHDKRVQMISLRFLKKLSTIRMIRHKIVYLGGIENMLTLLEESQIDMQQEIAETITNVADFHKAWKAVRLSGGISLLVSLIYLPKRLLQETNETMSKQLKAVVDAAQAAAEALFAVCKCRKNQMEFLRSGGLRGCQTILKTSHIQLAAITMQVVQLCASQKLVRSAVRRLGMLDDFYQHFYSDDQKLMQAAAQAAYICAEGEESKAFFRTAGFVDKLFEIIQRSIFHSDDKFMIAISGALWKCAENEVNSKRLQALNAAPFLIQLLGTQTSIVKEHIVACLTCCMKNPQMRIAVRKNNGIETLIGLLHTIHHPLIMHLNKALAIASGDNECLALIEKYNALRLIWSHLKNDNPSVVSNTAWQLTSIMKNIENSYVYTRSLAGGVQLLTDLLRSEHTRVLTPICALIVILCKEEENLRILTDYQVVKRLSLLTGTKCRRLRYHLCMAITACCPYRDNRQEFAKRKIVFPLIRIMKSKSPIVAGAATHALSQLAWIPKWCALMYNTPGVYKILMGQMKDKNQNVQECAADVIQKMRLFALNRDGNLPFWLLKKHAEFFSKR